jgi:hypothetical protein
MGMDLLELVAGEKILTAIDYFSRKAFAMIVKSKEPNKVLKYLDKIFLELPFKTLITDNGGEFRNDKVDECIIHNVKLIYAVPYNHQSNGRIEWANRTIRHVPKDARSAKEKVENCRR